MDRIERDRAVFLGLAALQDIADLAGNGPIPPSLQLRALLALMALQSNGDLRTYKEFWTICQQPYKEGQYTSGQDYERGLYADTALKGICRTVGIEPQNKDFTDAIWRILGPLRMKRCEPGYKPERAERGNCGWL